MSSPPIARGRVRDDERRPARSASLACPSSSSTASRRVRGAARGPAPRDSGPRLERAHIPSAVVGSGGDAAGAAPTAAHLSSPSRRWSSRATAAPRSRGRGPVLARRRASSAPTPARPPGPRQSRCPRPGLDLGPHAVVAVLASRQPEQHPPPARELVASDRAGEGGGRGGGSASSISVATVPPSRAPMPCRRAGRAATIPTLNSHTGCRLSTSLLARTTSIAPGSQAPLWMALPSTTAS